MRTTDKPKHVGRKVIGGIVGLILLIVIITSVGSSPKATVNTTAVTTKTSSTSSASSSTSGAKAVATVAKVGDTLNIGGSKGLAVTLQQIVDPASGADQYTTPDAGKRFIAVEVKIVNNGSGAYNDDANSDVTLIGSDNQSYTADFDDVSECTNFNDGSYTLAAGESATGCVVFEVPDAITAAKVQFQTVSGDESTGEWTVN